MGAAENTSVSNVFSLRLFFLIRHNTLQYIIALVMSFFVSAASAQIQVFTTDGTFTVPPGVTSILVECWGGGGAGGGSTENRLGGSGGGGGGYSSGTFTVTPGQEIPFIVGSGGIGSTGGPGTPGSSTTFLTLIANGGTGGGENLGDPGTGGTSSGGEVNLTGNNGSPGTVSGGKGGAGANGGAGGNGVTNNNGSAGTIPGGGGGGGEANGGTDRSGGNGASGQIRITIKYTFYAWQSGNAATLSNWNTEPDGSGMSPSNFNTDYQTYIIPAGISMTASSAWTVSGNGSTLQVQDGGSYVHGYNGGNIPDASWTANSNCIITGVTYSAPGNINQEFGNFTWNSTGQGTNNLDILFPNGTIIKGDFSLISTGTAGSIRFSNNLTKSLIINGNLVISGGILDLLRGSGSYIQTINLYGDLIITGGTVTESNTGSGSGSILFMNASTTQVFTKTGGSITNRLNFTVSNGSVLNVGTSVIEGGGNFTLGAGAGIITAHPQGLSTTAGTGSIQVTGTRSFNVTANYEYNGTVVQQTGNGLTAASKLTFNNTAGLYLTSSVTVSGSLIMIAGNVTTGGNIINISNGNATSLQHTSGTVIGLIRRAISTTSVEYLFPVGTEEFYRPAILNFTSLSAATNITGGFNETSPGPFTPYTDVNSLNFPFSEGFWRFLNSNAVTGSYSLKLKAGGFTSLNLDGTSKISGRTASNQTWRAMGTHGVLVGNEITRNGITTFNTTSFDFAISTCNELVTSGYSYERLITIDHNRVAGNEDLFNFPVMIKLSGQDFLKNVPSGRISNLNGWDIVFADNNNNKLDHQLEYYNGATGDIIAWVRIPLLSASSNTIIKMLYGNPGITNNPSVTSVWDSHYKGVWHFNDNSLEDATSYNKAATAYNSPSYPAGVINNAIGLNGTNEYAVVQNAPGINFAGNITISAWVYMNEGNRDQKIVGNQDGSSGGFKFGIYNNNKVEFEIRNSANTPSLNREVAGGSVLNTGQWYYLSGMSSDVLDSIKTFVNGIPERPYKKTGILDIASKDLVIGKEPFENNYYFRGMFDEMRISDKVRSAGWLRTEYLNQSAPSDFISTGEETVTADLLSVSICDDPLTLTFGFPAGGTYSGTDVSGNIFNPQSAGLFTITYTVAGSCNNISIQKNILVTPQPGTPIAPDIEFCSSQISYLQATGTNIKWYKEGALVSTANPYSPGISVPGSYTFTVTQTLNGCESPAETVILSIYSSVSIVSNPQNEEVCSGGNAIFTVQATGYNESYQWQENAGSGFVNIQDNSQYNGCTTSVLTVINPGSGFSGRSYRCIISSTCGSAQTSGAGILTVRVQPSAVISYTGLPWCPNAAAQSVEITGATGGAFSAPPGITVDASSGTVLPLASTPGDYIITYTISPSGGCSGVTATAPVSIMATITWTGSSGTSWTNPANWTCNMVPTSSVSARIPNVTSKPVLGAAGASVKNLTIEAGSSVTLSGRTLRIAGSIINNGTLSADAATIEFNGNSPQFINAGNFTGDVVQNFTVSNIAGVSLLADLDLKGILKVQSGSLNSDGHLTLVSSAAGTALIDGSGAGNVTGYVTMERYLPSGKGYKYISSPFSDATVYELADDTDIDPEPDPDSYFPPIFGYDENRFYLTYPLSPWIVYDDPSYILEQAKGYSVFFGADDLPKTFEITGTVNNGPLTINVANHNQEYTKGFNLIGNPYPSPVDWSHSEIIKNNVDNALYFFRTGGIDEYDGAYSSWVNGVSVDPDVTSIIPSMQAFMIHVSDGDYIYPKTGSVTFSNQARTTTTSQVFFKKSVSAPDKSLIRLSAAYSDYSPVADPLVIYIDEKATPGFDSYHDALKLLNSGEALPSFYSVIDGQKQLSINGLPWPEDTVPPIPLGLSISKDCDIIFSLNSQEGYFEGRKLSLYDSAALKSYELTAGKDISIRLEEGQYNNRFFLNMENLMPVQVTEPGDEKIFDVYSYRGSVRAVFNYPGNLSGTVTIYNISGIAVFNTKITGNGSYEWYPGLKTGIYIFRFMSGSHIVTKRLFIE